MIYVIDDAGRRVPLFTIGALRRSARDNPERLLLARRLGAFAGKGFFLGLPTVAGMIVALPLLVFVVVAPFVLMGFMPCALVLIPFLLPAALLVFDRNIGQRRGAPALAASIASEGICASCGYPIVGLPADDTGRVTCPECSAEWDRRRLVPDGVSFPIERAFASARRIPKYPKAIRLTTDHRDRVAPRLGSRLVGASPPAVPKPDRAELFAELRGGGRWWRLALLVTGVAAATALVAAAASLPNLSPTQRSVLLVIAGPLVFLAAAAYGSEFGIPRDHVGAVLRRRRRCAACATSLDGVEAGDDGKTPCPVCGAAWRLPGPPGPARPADHTP